MFFYFYTIIRYILIILYLYIHVNIYDYIKLYKFVELSIMGDTFFVTHQLYHNKAIFQTIIYLITIPLYQIFAYIRAENIHIPHSSDTHVPLI